MASVALLVLALWWTPAEARQADPSADPPPRPEVVGRVVDATSGEPIEGAGVRLLADEGERVLAVTTTGVDGAFVLSLDPDLAPGAGPVVVDAGALGYRPATSEPFELDLAGTVTVPEFALQPDPLALDTIRVEDRRWRARMDIPPRTRVLDRQLEGRGTFFSGAVLGTLPERETDWALANQVDGLWIHPRYGLLSERNRDGCMVYLINQWPVRRNAVLDLDRSRIGAMEIYLEFDDVPEELKFHVMNAGTMHCGLVNVWLWHEWNRGIGGGGS